MDDDSRGIRRFKRTLINRLIHPSSNTDSTYLPKFTTPRVVSHAQSDMNNRLEHHSDLILMDQYFKITCRTLKSHLESPRLQSMIQRQRPNHTREDIDFIRRIMNDSSITCKPADKNLGLVLVDTSWYDTEILRMLSDTNTYIEFTGRADIDGKPHQCTLDQLKSLLWSTLQSIVNRHSRTLESWNKDLYDRQLKRYMKARVKENESVIPIIYLLIKVHKPKGLCGRPIVPCTNWITTPASVLADHLLQAIVRKANIKWIVKDTKSFVNELEHTHLSHREGIFVTADIASLYTNIDTTMGLKLVRQFLLEQSVELSLINLIMDLLSFVMRHSYLSFKDKVYHQVDGTAMGTAVAPTWANIFVFMLEKIIITEFGDKIRLYRRFLDDVFAFIEGKYVEAFMTRMNQLHPKLVFEFTSDPNEASFLDLCIYKGDRFRTDGRFDIRVHQKSMNLYLYLPYLSYHTESTKRSFIQTELMRYIRNSSSRDSYLVLKRLFYSRLRDRGYPPSFLGPIFDSIYYDDRRYFLYPSSELLNHPDLSRTPPLSLCLRKRLVRASQSVITNSSHSSDNPNPPVFIIPYTPVSHVIPTKAILSQHWYRILSVMNIPRPIIAYQSELSLTVKLVHQKARRTEQLRLKQSESNPPSSNMRIQEIEKIDVSIDSNNTNHANTGPILMDCSSQ